MTRNNTTRPNEKDRNADSSLHRIISDNPDGMVIVDAGGFVRFTNRAAAEIFGRTADEVVGEQFGLPFKAGETSELRIKKRLNGQYAYGYIEMQVVETEWEGETAYLAAMRDITERKRTEQNLRESSSHIEKILESISDAFMAVDHDWRFTYVNRRAEKLVQKSREELIGRHMWEIFPEAVGSIFHRQYYKAMEQQVPVTFEGFYPPLDAWFEVHGYPSPDLLSIYFTDITERKSQENALRESEERYSSLFENNHTIMLVVDPETGRIVDANPAACLFYGYRREELNTMHISEINTLSLEEVHRKMAEARAQETAQFQFKHRLKSGEIRDVEVFSGPIVIKGEKLLYSHVHDVTERRKTEEALRESEARFRLAVDNIPDIFVIYDSNRRYRFINAAGLSMSGYREEDIIGRRDEEVFPPEITGTYLPALEKAITCRTVETTVSTIAFQGNTFVLNVTYIPVLDEDGRIRQVLGFTHNITDRKRAEEEIEILNTNLANRALELEAANQELEMFSYTVSHDLRRPLTNISGYCQVLQQICGDDLNEECKEFLCEIHNGIVDMNQLIDTLLNFSLIMRTELRLDRVDLSNLAERIRAELMFSDPHRNVTWKIEKGIIVRGDANLLRVVLENLIGNAWKYTGKQEQAVIEFASVEKQGSKAYMVRDNGVGFDMTEAGKLFSAFQRLHRTSDFKGHGIGLATVQRIIHRHGGKVWAEAEEGKGAAFYFTLGC